MLKRLLIVMVVVGAVVAAGFRISDRQLPNLSDSGEERPTGAFHVHSEASHDSELSLDAIATAAKRLGLDFVILTDHNNQLAGPVTIKGVTLLSYSELSTPFGHVIQLGAGYLLPEEDRDKREIHDAIRELGGVSILAHPSDRKRPWEGEVNGAGGLEIASLSSSFRRQAGPVFINLLPAVLVWRFRKDLAFAQVYDRDARSLAIWDGESDPRLVGICGGDVHGRIDVQTNLLGWHLVLEGELPVEEDTRAAAIVDMVTTGSFHCVAGLFGRNPSFLFGAYDADEKIGGPGEDIPVNRVTALEVVSPKSNVPLVTVLLRGGNEVMRSHDQHLAYTNPSRGAYRVEVRAKVPGLLFGSRSLPIVYSNRIRVVDPEPLASDETRAPPPEPVP